MLNIINLLVSAISGTFYNCFLKDENEEMIKIFKRYFIVFVTFSILVYFVLSGIILKKYIPAFNIISVSFTAYLYMIVINAFYMLICIKLEKMRGNISIFL